MARRALTLLGTDVLLLAMGGRRPNNAVFVVECDGHVDAARVSEGVRRLADLAPWVGARLERPFPWGRLRWRVEAPLPPTDRPLVAVRQGGEARAVDAALNDAIDPRHDPPLRIEIVAGEDAARRPTTWLVVTWAHALMDPRGAELLVAMVDALARDDAGRAWARARLLLPPADPRPWRERMRIARQGVERLRRVVGARPASLGREAGAGGRVRHRRVVLPAGAARQLPATLALVSSAVTPLWIARDVPLDDPFLVPISVDRRRKGEPGPLFGNYLSFHFARVPAGTAADREAIAAAVRQDLADAVRTDAVEATWVAMNFARYHPPSALLRPVGGDDMASFNCADTGEVRPAATALFGRPVRGAYHVPCVQPRPGFGVFFSRAAGLESAVVVWVEPVLSDADVDGILARLADGMRAARAA